MPVTKLERLVVFGKDSVSPSDAPKKDLMTLTQLGLIGLAVTRAKCQQADNLSRDKIIDVVYPNGDDVALLEEAQNIILDSGIVDDQIRERSVIKILNHINAEKCFSEKDFERIRAVFDDTISSSLQVGYLKLAGSFVMGIISSGIIAMITYNLSSGG